jgi:catechol 2,3-dioxygenase-like lactoylglutathione lyase family enzyme
MVDLSWEGVVGYGAQDAEDAAHFFEHLLGLRRSGDDEGTLRFYAAGDLSIAVDVSGALAGEPPYLVFSASDLTQAAEHFLERLQRAGAAVGAGRRLSRPLARRPHRVRRARRRRCGRVSALGT